MDAARVPVGGDLFRQAEVTHYSCVATGLAAHQAVLGAQEDLSHQLHQPCLSGAPRMPQHSTASCSPACHAWGSKAATRVWDKEGNVVPWSIPYLGGEVTVENALGVQVA